MDNRLIFCISINRLSNEGRRRLRKSVRLEVYQAVSRLMSQMLITDATSCDGEGASTEVSMSHCREKLLARFIGPGYRKNRTQVVEERILR